MPDKEQEARHPTAGKEDQDSSCQKPSLLEQMVHEPGQGAQARPGPDRPLVGECTDDAHPVLQGRVRVRWSEGRREPEERWLPCLQGLVARRADRVLLQRPANWPEPLVVGVVDGFTPRPEAPRKEGASLRLRADERLTIVGENGRELLQVHQDREGPVIRLLVTDLVLEVPGAFRLSADRIELLARRGSVEVEATDDVNLHGEMINLN